VSRRVEESKVKHPGDIGNMNSGIVEAIFIGRRAEPLRSVLEAMAVLGRGLEEDRYGLGTGTFSTYPGNGRQVTLIEMEAIESLPDDCAIDPAAARRNLVTRGVSLNDLVGCDFRIGEAVLRGVRLCHPCEHLENLTRPGVLHALQNRGGLRADILQGGIIRIGDQVVLVDH
jgi:MOSC domain-containing protein YiiM